MSTKNSSAYASKHSSIAPPIVPYCHKCKYESKTADASLSQSQSSTLSTLPHHGLCPKHSDFYNSGSYEVLNLIVDGNLLDCEACIHQFRSGRLNKKLVHCGQCTRGKGGNGSGGKKGAAKKRQSSSGVACINLQCQTIEMLERVPGQQR